MSIDIQKTRGNYVVELELGIFNVKCVFVRLDTECVDAFMLQTLLQHQWMLHSCTPRTCNPLMPAERFNAFLSLICMPSLRFDTFLKVRMKHQCSTGELLSSAVLVRHDDR